jgi:hypothetical protein
MFMKKLLLVYYLFIYLSFSSFAQTMPVWAGKVGGPEYDWCNTITTDNSGNVYVAGNFSDTADLDPGNGHLDHIATGSGDLFVEKLDNSGNLLWVKQMPGVNYGRGTTRGLAVDENHNIYITGWFQYKMDFDPGPDTFVLTSNNDLNAFVCKLDSAGNFIWAKQIAGTRSQATSVAVALSGAVYVSGWFWGTIDFDPGSGNDSISTSGTDAFVLKLDNHGYFRWVQNFGAGDARGKSIILDDMENILLYGQFRGTIDFDKSSSTYNLTAAGYTTGDFIYKADSAGNFIMAKKVVHDLSYFQSTTALDVNGNIYVTGSFSGTEDFDPGPGVYTLTSTSPSWNDAFVYKLDINGNFMWAKQTQNGSGHCVGYSIRVDPLGNSYIIGCFMAAKYPGATTFPYNSMGQFDVFFLKLNSSGDSVCSASFGGMGDDFGYSLALDGQQNIFVAGTFEDTLNFSTPLFSKGYDDIFIAKYESCDLATEIADLDNQSVLTIFPNPSHGRFHVSLTEGGYKNGQIYVYNFLGQMIYSAIITRDETDIDLKTSPNGIYTIEVISGNNEIRKKFVIN